MGIRHICDCCGVVLGILNSNKGSKVIYKDRNTGKKMKIELCDRCFAGLNRIGVCASRNLQVDGREYDE